MDRVQLRPAEGRLVRDPASGEPMPAEGLEVEMNIFWHRRLADGDVQPVPAPTTRRAKQEG